MNYYIDEQSLPLKDHNIYTAVEIVTLIPVKGPGLHAFFNANAWVNQWFPAYPLAQTKEQPQRSWLKKSVEWMLNNKAGDKLDNYFLGMTARRWKRKGEQRKLNYEGKEMVLITGKHFAWSNPDFFQEKIIGLYNKKLTELMSAWPLFFQPLNLSFEE